eukprot:2393222-Prorocentrum_lima.AAC.1
MFVPSAMNTTTLDMEKCRGAACSVGRGSKRSVVSPPMAFQTLYALSVRDRCDASGRACQIMAKPD